jgi:hypothetical protein
MNPFLGILVGIVMCAATVPVLAQRDPTVPPPEAVVAPSTGEAVVSRTPWGQGGMAVVIRNGKSYLVDGTRLFAVGQKIGNYRIERISETEVWLRSGKELRKVPRFNGIQRKPSESSRGTNP